MGIPANPASRALDGIVRVALDCRVHSEQGPELVSACVLGRVGRYCVRGDAVGGGGGGWRVSWLAQMQRLSALP